jgi:sugar-phosphatase
MRADKYGMTIQAASSSLPCPLAQHFDAAIFDMDGVLVESTHFWKQAEREVFSRVDIHITEQMSKATESMTTAEAAAYWYRFRPWSDPGLRDMEQAVVRRVAELVSLAGFILPGVQDTLDACRRLAWKTALASNSPRELCMHVLSTLQLTHDWDAIVSAEDVSRGKPAADIFLHTAKLLGAPAARCLVFEDSPSGVRAAREAGMTVIAVCPLEPLGDELQHSPQLHVSSLAAFHSMYLNHVPVGQDRTQHPPTAR